MYTFYMLVRMISEARYTVRNWKKIIETALSLSTKENDVMVSGLCKRGDDLNKKIKQPSGQFMVKRR